MKKSTFLRALACLLLTLGFTAGKSTAQTASISPQNATIGANTPQAFTVTTTGMGGSNNDRTFVYTITGPGSTTPASPATFNCTSGCNTQSHSFTFSAVGVYTVSVTVTQTQGGSATATTSTTITVAPPTVTISPAPTATVLTGGSINFSSSIEYFSGSTTTTYAWSAPGATVPSGSSSSKTITFPTVGIYVVTVTATRGSQVATSAPTVVNVVEPNMYATAGSGAITAYHMNAVTGNILAGPQNVVTPSGSTAALGLNKSIPTFDPGGCLYYTLNTSTASNNGIVQIYAVNRNGTGNTLVGSIDMNGVSDNTGLGFVRLGMDPAGYGWIIAGNGSTQLRIAKFRGNGTNPITDVNTFGNVNLTVTNGAISDFQNGDLAFSGNGTLYALSNTTGGPTYIYTLNSTSNPPTRGRRWTVIPAGGSTFSGSVNGIAFTTAGSIHVSTSNGIFFIDGNTASQQTGTVEASLIFSATGFTDLASSAFPEDSPLPVKLLDFSGSLRNNVATIQWKTESEVNFDRFEVERSSKNNNFSTIGTETARGGSSRTASYSFADNLANETENVFHYRLKMIDTDGKFTYSHIIMMRKSSAGLKGLSLAPNPVVSSTATARVDVSSSTTVTLRVMDLSGKLVLQQKNAVAAGVNSIPVLNVQQLQPGTYVLQLINGDEIQSVRFTVAR